MVFLIQHYQWHSHELTDSSNKWTHRSFQNRFYRIQVECTAHVDVVQHDHDTHNNIENVVGCATVLHDRNGNVSNYKSFPTVSAVLGQNCCHSLKVKEMWCA